MMRLIEKITFLKKKPEVVIVGGENSQLAKSAIFQVLNNFLRVADISEKGPAVQEIRNNQVLIFGLSVLTPVEKVNFWLQNSSLPILAITDLKSLHPQEKIDNLIKILPSFGYLVINFDDEIFNKEKERNSPYILTFGFNEKADLSASDYRRTEEGINFKLNFKGNTLPVWLQNFSGREKEGLCAALCALSVAQILNLNLVEASQVLSRWKA